MLTAYAAGYEVWAELLVREPVPLHQKGWHPTAVRGTVAAAAACAKLRRLDADATATALAIAASMAGGLVANFGTLTKCFQVGRAAQSGVLAARLAQAGMTAAADALEHRPASSPRSRPAASPLLDQPLDARYEGMAPDAPGPQPQALSHLLRHPSRDRRGGRPGEPPRPVSRTEVDSIRVATGKMQMLMLRNERPQTAFEAKFSMQFAMASALVARNVGLAQLTDEFVRSAPVQALIPRVSTTTTTETMAGSAFAPSESVEITTRDGRVLASEPIVFAKGSKQRPLSHEELRIKFLDCLGHDLNGGAGAFEKLMNLERLGGAGELLASH